MERHGCLNPSPSKGGISFAKDFNGTRISVNKGTFGWCKIVDYRRAIEMDLRRITRKTEQYKSIEGIQKYFSSPPTIPLKNHSSWIFTGGEQTGRSNSSQESAQPEGR